MKERSPRLARLKLLLKDEGLDRLENATVMVIGLGGVGSACAEALARGGVGNLILLDRDFVEESNINRQALAFTCTLGKMKADVMKQMVYEINPDIVTYAQPVFLTKDGLDEILGAFPKPDYVLDCIDTVTQKLAIARWCAEREIPLLSSMGAANKLDPTYLKFAKIEKTVNCPFARVIRTECRNLGIKGLEVLYSTELAYKPKNSTSRSKGENLGSMSYMPPIMGQMMAGQVIRRLAGMEEVPLPPRLRHRPETETLEAETASQLPADQEA